MAGLFGRIFKQWAEDFLVKRLSENASFQKAAVGAVSAAQQAQTLVEAAAKDPSRVTAGLSALMAALKAEAAKDLGSGAAAGGGGPVVDVTSAAPPAPPPPPADGFGALSSKALKEELAKRGASAAGLYEKAELLAELRRVAKASPSGAKAEMK